VALWVGQFGIEGGEAREKTSWVGAYPDPGRSEEPSDLYVLVTPAAPGSEEFCGEMKDVVAEAFHRDKLSLTGGMLRALRGAHQNLREWNKRSLPDHQVAAGISCLAVQDGRAFTAQVAPARAVFYRDGELMTITPELPDARDPLGQEEEFRPDFRRFDLETNDRLLLLTPSLAAVLSEEDLREALSRTGEESLPLLYRRARGAGDCGALLVIVTEVPADGAPA
jgi:serine/threonine protein phosphatase PrpC